MNTVPFSVEARKVDTGEMMVTVIGEIDLATGPQFQGCNFSIQESGRP